MDLRTLLLHIRDNPSDRAIARDLGLDRRTVGRYRQWASEQQLLTDPLPALEDLQQRQADTLPDPRPPQTVSAVEPYRELVVQWREQGVEMAAIHQRLREQGFAGSYSAVQRFVHGRIYQLGGTPGNRASNRPFTQQSRRCSR